jgi:hypothetical protein
MREMATVRGKSLSLSDRMKKRRKRMANKEPVMSR